MAKETAEETIARLTAEKAELEKKNKTNEGLVEKLNKKVSEAEDAKKSKLPVITPAGMKEQHVVNAPKFRLPGDKTEYTVTDLKENAEVVKKLFAIDGQTVCVPLKK